MRYVGNVFRPPSEADSLLLQVTIGCSHNRCGFCAMYRDKEFRVRRLEHVLEDIKLARDYHGALDRRNQKSDSRLQKSEIQNPESKTQNPGVRRVFLCDGDAMVLPTKHLLSVLESLEQTFPELQRVGIYANARDILKKPEEELRELVRHRLGIFYIGLESGSDRILEWIDKGATAAEMVEAVRKAQACGMKASVIYLLGLGGRKLWRENAVESARAVSQMNPNYLSALTVTVIPGTPLAEAQRQGFKGPRGQGVEGRKSEPWDPGNLEPSNPVLFELPSPEELALELRLFLEHVDVKATVFRSNHASNYVPLAGRLPKDKERLVAELDSAIRHHRFKPEYLRGL